jgi:hypothetical protein
VMLSRPSQWVRRASSVSMRFNLWMFGS